MALADWNAIYSKAKAHIDGHDTQTLPYLLELVRVDGLPKSKNGLEISISLYDSAQNACYGSTWRSLSVSHPFLIKQELVFHSEVSAATMLLVELIQIDITTYKKQTLGWTALKLLNNNFANKRFEIFFGSSRALFFMTEPSIANTALEKREGVLLTMSLHQRSLLRNLNSHLPPNYLGNTSHLLKLNNTIQPATLFLENVEVHIGTEVKKFEDHILFLLMADAKQQNSNIRQFDKVTIKERRLKASIHNGLKYTDQFQVVYLENNQNVCLKSKGVISLSSIDPRNYIIFSLEYVLEVPVSFSNLTLVSSMRQSQVHIVALRWGIWAPSGNLPNSGTMLHVTMSGGPGLNPEKKLTFTSDFGPMNSIYDARVDFKLVKQEGDMAYLDTHLETTYTDVAIQPDGLRLTKSTVTESTVDVPMVEQEYVQARQRMQTPLEREPLAPLVGENILHHDIKTQHHDISVNDIEKATYAQIHNAGFPDLVDSDGRPAIELDLAKHYVYSDVLERNDPRTCNSVFFQFLAVSFRDRDIKNMFFTVQFYRFVAATTPILSITSTQRNLPSILYKQDKSDLHPGCTISYKVDPGASTAEPEQFLKHIQSGNCIIDVWNSDSLFHIGTVSAKLKRVARQGEHGVQTTQVFNVHQDQEFVGKLHLRIANIGSIPDRYDIKEMETSVIIDLMGTDENTELILRPKPLSNIDQNLASILSSQSFQKSSKNRKMERMEAVRKRQDTSYIIPVSDAHKTLRAGELTMIKNYRNKIQNDVIRQSLVASITKQHTLYTEFGSVSYFEVLFINTSSSDQVYGVTWDTPNIRLVYDTEECAALKHMYNVSTPHDPGVFTSSSSPAKLLLRPREQIYLPYTYLANSTKPDITHVMKFTNEAKSPIFVINLCFKQKRQIINDKFMFYEAENTFAKRSINLASGDMFKAGELKVRCSDENVICNVDSNKQIYFKAPVGKSNEISRFLLLLYVDKYCYRPYEIWQVDLFSLKRVDMNAVVGSQTKFPVILRGADTVRAVSCFTSNPHIVKVLPDREFVLMPSTIQEVKIMFEPAEAGTRDYMVNVVDTKHKIVIERWMVRTTSTFPVISKTYDLPTSTSLTPTHKNISFTNPYQTTKTFRLKSNKPELVTFKSTELTIASNESQNVGLILSPHALSHPNHILVFLTDVDQKCEECFAIRVAS